MKKIMILLAFCTLLCSAGARADEKSDKMKPRWVTSSLPKPKSPGYFFISTDARGNTLEEARLNAFINVRAKLEDERQLEFEGKVETQGAMESQKGKKNASKSQEYLFRSKVTDAPLILTFKVVDEYWEYKDGKYTVKDLFTVNESGQSSDIKGIDNIRLTTSYGAAPVFYSLIPGVGQFVKGSTLKGGLILGGTAVGAAAIILCENQRATYAKKMKEKPQHIDFYRNKKADWTLGRNVAIGATAALYLYNLIDAAVAPGRRRVIVNKRSYEYSLAPVVTGDSFGVGFAMNF